MSVLILCKDCGEQFNNQSSSKRLNAAIELANASSQISVKYVDCMGVCPKNKISTALIDSNTNNKKQVKALDPDQICQVIKKSLTL